MRLKKITVNNLGIISTQFQLLNAIEFSKSFLKSKKLSLIVLIHNKIHEKQIKQMASKFNIKIIYSIRFRKGIQYIDLFIKLMKFKIKYSVENLIIGHTKNNMMLLSLKLIDFKKLNLVDDGEILEVKDLKPSINKKYFPINYYSIFDLKSNKFFRFIKNEYEYFKLKSKKKINNKILFIGVPFVEHNAVPKKLYLSLIEKVLNKEKTIDYIMHPRERADKFKNIKNINFFSYKYGVEQYILDSDLLPAKIISFYSTALTSLRLIINSEEVNLSFIDLRKYLKSKYARDVEYDYLKKNNGEYMLE
tara:strand:- start:19 stop:933 length:915 start_codon:yes stop_codon:yes gene_type:complete